MLLNAVRVDLVLLVKSKNVCVCVCVGATLLCYTLGLFYLSIVHVHAVCVYIRIRETSYKLVKVFVLLECVRPV